MTDLDELGRALANSVRIEERPGFREDLRARLLGQVGTAAEARRRRGQRLGWLRPLVAAIGGLALLIGTAGTVAAGSLPGEPGFALKRAAEELVLAVAPDDPARAERLVAQTDARLAELRRAAPGSETSALAIAEYAGAAERLASLVERLRLPTTDARHGAVLELAAGAARSHLGTLETLTSTTPAAAQEALRRAIEAGRRISVPTGPPSDRDSAPVPAPGRPGTNTPVPARTSAPSGTGPGGTSPAPAPTRTPPGAPERPEATPGAPGGSGGPVGTRATPAITTRP